MAIYRAIKDSYIYKESCILICKVIGIDLPHQVLNKSAAIFSHKVLNSGRPQPIYKMIRFPTHMRACKDKASQIGAWTKRSKRGLIYRIPIIYNALPYDLKHLNVKKFRLKLKKYNIADVEVD